MPPIVRRSFFHFLPGVGTVARMVPAPTGLYLGDVLRCNESLDESHAGQIRAATEPEVSVRHISQRKRPAILLPKQVAVPGDRQRSKGRVPRVEPGWVCAGPDKLVDLLCEIFPVAVAVQQYRHRSISNDVVDEVAGGNAVILFSLVEEACVGVSRAGIDQRLLVLGKKLLADDLRPKDVGLIMDIQPLTAPCIARRLAVLVNVQGNNSKRVRSGRQLAIELPSRL